MLDGPVLVTGATGLHGGAVCHRLLTAGRRVRALTRDLDGDRARQLSQLGAELILGDLMVTKSLIAAMRGICAVYAVTTPFGADPDAEVEQGEHIIAAARKAEAPWLILASVASADRATGIPHFESKAQIEQQLAASSIPYTVVAPTYFYENLGDLDEIIASAHLALPLPATRPLQQVALADLGALVVALLDRQDEFLGQRIEVAADQPTPLQMAEALASASDQPVGYQQVELATRSGDIAAMYRYLEQTGYQVNIGDLRNRFPEVAWTSFAEWTQQRITAR
jgi:uncharacterized protein YbjT (DUF2867 family)